MLKNRNITSELFLKNAFPQKYKGGGHIFQNQAESQMAFISPD